MSPTLRVSLGAIAVGLFASPVFAAPTLGPEYGLDVPITTPLPTEPRAQPKIATNGSEYMVVFATNQGPRARRLSMTGVLLDTEDIVVGDGTSGSAPLVFADGDDFIVVYWLGNQTWWERFDPSGLMISLTPLNWSTHGSWYPVARTPNGLVASDLLYLNLLDNDGQLVGQAFSPLGLDCPSTGVSYANGVILWACRNSVDGLTRVTRYDENLVRLDTTPQIVSGPSQGVGRVTTDGTSFFVTIGNVGHTVGTDGTVGLPVTFPFTPGAISASNGAYNLVGVSGTDVRRERVSTTTLQPIGAESSVGTSAFGNDVAAGATDSNELVAWIDSSHALRGTALDATGAVVVQDQLVSDSMGLQANAQSRPRVATNAAGISLVVWTDNRSGSDAIWGMRVDANGVPLDAAPKQMPGNIFNGVAANGTDFFIAYQGTGQCGNYTNFFQRIRVNGTSDPPVAVGLNCGNDIYGLTPATDGSNVLYYRQRQVGQDVSWVSVGLMAPDGTLTTPQSLLLEDGYPVPGAIFQGGNYYLGWTESSAGNTTIHATSMDTAGVLAPTASFIANGSGGGIWSIGGQMFVTSYSAVPSWQTQGIPINASVQVVDAPFLIAPDYVYQLHENATGAVAVTWHYAGSIMGYELDTAGHAVDSVEIAASTTEFPMPVMTGNGEFVLYGAYVPELHAERIRVRRLTKPGGDGDGCVDASQCNSGFCVAGVCCATDCTMGTCESGGCSTSPQEMGGGGAGGGGAGGAGIGGAGGAAEGGGGGALGGSGGSPVSMGGNSAGGAPSNGGSSAGGSAAGGQPNGGDAAGGQGNGNPTPGDDSSCSAASSRSTSSTTIGWLALGVAAALSARRARQRHAAPNN
ncbi:MAG: hypothetical protein U0271_37695 [Polyangiaceae bacterium]